MLIEDAHWIEPATLTHQRTNKMGEYLPVETISRRPLGEIAMLLSLMDSHEGMHVDLPDRHEAPFGFGSARISELIKAYKNFARRSWG